MAYNLGYVSTSYNLGYVGVYTADPYPYVLTDHGVADTNSFMASANFATTQPVDIGVTTDFDSAKIVVDWQAVSDGQLWRQDINTLAAVTVNATTDTTATCTLAYRVTETGETGTFDVTVNVVAEVTATAPQFAPVIGTITKDTNSASIPFTYPGSDATSFQASTNGVDWVTVTSPISRTGLSASTAYSGQVRAVNSAGTGTSASYNFTTEALPMPNITLEGGTVYLDVGEAYVEPGFSASDPVDGDITLSVTTSTDLNTASAGTYSKTYSVTNSNGATVSETRIIIVSAVGDNWRFSKRISYAAPKTWTWGNRHPKTGMRVRIYK